MTGTSRAPSAAGSDEPARCSAPEVAVPSAGTGVARAIPTRYPSKGAHRYLPARPGGRLAPPGQRRLPFPPLPPFPFRGRGGGRFPPGRVDPDAARAPADALALPDDAAAPVDWAASDPPPLTAPPLGRPDEAAPGRMTPAVWARARPCGRPPPLAPAMAAAAAGVNTPARSPLVSSRWRMVV